MIVSSKEFIKSTADILSFCEKRKSCFRSSVKPFDFIHIVVKI